MENNRKQKGASGVAKKIIRPRRCRNLPEMMGVLDDTLTDLLNDTIEVRKANSVSNVVGKWMCGLNTAIRGINIRSSMPKPLVRTLGLPVLSAPTVKPPKP